MQKYNILLIDADLSHLNFIIKELEKFSYFNLLCANQTELANNIFNKRKIDLVLLDWKTASTSEIDFFKLFKKQTLSINIPLIIWAEKDTFRLNEPLIKIYSKNFIFKPVKSQELLKQITQYYPIEEKIESIETTDTLIAPHTNNSQQIKEDNDELSSIEQKFLKQKIHLDEEKERLLIERNKLLQIRRKLTREWRKLEREKEDLRIQQEKFTDEENRFFEDQIILQNQKKEFENQLQAFQAEKEALRDTSKKQASKISQSK